jgi:GT2 family glycosyltransferase
MGHFLKKKNNLDVQSIDVICLTNTKDKDYFNMTKYALETLHSSEKKYKFNVNLVESNYNSSYNYDNLVTNYIKPNEPFNYNKFLNICNKYITSDWVIIINNDVFFEKDWFNNIVKEHQKNNDIKSFSPKDPRHFNKWFPWAIFEYDNNIYEGYTIAQMVFGWCLVMKKEVWDLIYPWDENFVLYYQDNDYVEMLKSLGIRHAMVNNSIVNHLGSMTVDVAFGEKEDDNIKDSELTFINKWNRF